MEAGIANQLWTLAEIVALLDYGMMRKRAEQILAALSVPARYLCGLEYSRQDSLVHARVELPAPQYGRARRGALGPSRLSWSQSWPSCG